MEIIERVNSAINGFVWGPIMLVLLVGTGIYLTIATRFFQISHISLWFKSTFGSLGKKHVKDDNITPFQAVSTALASTVGTGNIAGVTTAIVTGGPGAMFWMWFAAFFGMMTKYSEVVLAVHFREKDENGIHYGGPMYYISKGAKLKWLGTLFAIFATLACFGIGNMTQSNSMASVINENFGVPTIVTGIVIAVLVALVIIGGIKRIASVTEKIVPLMCVLYILSGFLVIVLNLNKMPDAFALIFEEAFSLRSVGGGIMGYVIAQGMRYGFARGIFSNEAGLGSAPIAHAASNTKNPVEQGMWGVFEVFIDTFLVCSITGLAVITSGLLGKSNANGAALTSLAFAEHIGKFGSTLLTVSLIFFAFSTTIGWSYYGEKSLGYLTNNNKTIALIYKAIFIVVVVIGATMELTLAWNIADTLNGLMAIPNLIGLLILSPIVFNTTKSYLKDPRSVDMKD